MHAASSSTDWLSEHSAANIKKLTQLENGAVVESLTTTLQNPYAVHVEQRVRHISTYLAIGCRSFSSLTHLTLVLGPCICQSSWQTYWQLR